VVGVGGAGLAGGRGGVDLRRAGELQYGLLDLGAWEGGVRGG